MNEQDYEECEKLTRAYKDLTTQIAKTDVYSDMCDGCKDDILLYPSISGKTDYTDEEVYSMALQRIISQLSDKTAECEKLQHRLEITQAQLDFKAYEAQHYCDTRVEVENKLQIAKEALSKGFDLIGCLSVEDTINLNIINDYVELTNEALERIME